MNYKTHNDSVAFESSSLIGYINVDYQTLKKIFGKPFVGDGYKSDAEWEIKFKDGTYATIYNYKDGKNYNGSLGLPKTEITNWHVGGKSKKALQLIKQVLNIK